MQKGSLERKNKKGWKLGRQGTTVGVPSTATFSGTKQEISAQARMAAGKEKPSAGLGRGQEGRRIYLFLPH